MLSRLRRSAGLLAVLFAGHLTMVNSGAVCTTPGMAAMNGSQAEQDAPMAGMASSMMSEGGATAATTSSELASSDHAPCSAPAQGTCVTGTACVTALGAAPAGGFAASSASSASSAIALTVSMPVSLGSAPDLPPPRA